MEEMNGKTFPKVVKGDFDKMERPRWDECLSKLTDQNKFADTCMLEEDSVLCVEKMFTGTSIWSVDLSTLGCL